MTLIDIHAEHHQFDVPDDARGFRRGTYYIRCRTGKVAIETAFTASVRTRKRFRAFRVEPYLGSWAWAVEETGPRKPRK